jgi:hypothetical protein
MCIPMLIGFVALTLAFISFFHSVQIGSGNEILQGVNVADLAGALDELPGLFNIAFGESVLACKE